MVTKKQADGFDADDEATVLKNGEMWTKRINLDLPLWVIHDLDREATRRGITRQSLIKTWLIDKIDSLSR